MTNSVGSRRWAVTAGLVALTGAAALAVAPLVPPTAVGLDAQPTEFSAERAFDDIELLAGHLRPMGSQSS